MVSSNIRKIIHIDMDAFYAAVEQRDRNELKGLPVAVGYDGKRGVIATASYEARQFGVHSAMPTSTAKRLCRQLIIITPRFEAYRAVSKKIQDIFTRYTDLIEPVALDEAYLDVSENKQHIPTAWKTAQAIRNTILEETGLTASAGVSYNKFLAKAASNLNKPNGQYIILPEMGKDFIKKLPTSKFHGIGPATTEKMRKLGIITGADLEKWPQNDLEERFGKLGRWYYQIARGIDERPVEPHRIRKSVSAETTFDEDIENTNSVEGNIVSLVNEIWVWVMKTKMYGRTVTVKIKWTDFQQSTRSKTLKTQISDKDEFKMIATELALSVFPVKKGIRLLGVGLSNFNAVETVVSKQASFDF